MTDGDANAKSFEDILSRYYSFNSTDVSVLKVTSAEILNYDLTDSPRRFVEYMLVQNHIDKTLFK